MADRGRWDPAQSATLAEETHFDFVIRIRIRIREDIVATEASGDTMAAEVQVTPSGPMRTPKCPRVAKVKRAQGHRRTGMATSAPALLEDLDAAG